MREDWMCKCSISLVSNGIIRTLMDILTLYSATVAAKNCLHVPIVHLQCMHRILRNVKKWPVLSMRPLCYWKIGFPFWVETPGALKICLSASSINHQRMLPIGKLEKISAYDHFSRGLSFIAGGYLKGEFLCPFLSALRENRRVALPGKPFAFVSE